MKTEKQIRSRVSALKYAFKKAPIAFTRLLIRERIRELLWVLDENNDR